MLKFLLIITLVIYSLYKTASFLFRIVLGGQPKRQSQGYYNRKRASDDKVHVDKAPSENKSRGDYQGGEYIDFEEVK
ncbi:MAG: DUF4834 domain-containing protein [Bacteroidota bacterium]